ncbi:MAG: DUF3800 domain-containing protein [Verrucomicrobiota bacterium]|nr:DUF3800 domain-containing protein [Verrucomicrobiota bacterium]
MHLIYIDESGNTGTNLSDPQQPVFLLCALIVPEDRWLAVEQALVAELDKHFPGRPADFEVHTNEIINSRGYFRQFSIDQRLNFIKAWLAVAQSFELKVIHRAIVKKRYASWLHATFGPGVMINPHNAAFLLIAQCVNDYLKNTPGTPLGILIADENQEVMPDVEKFIRLLRGESGTLKLCHIIEKGFFIESRQSLLLQLCDVCAFALRRMEEEKADLPVKPIDKHLIPWVKPLIYRGIEPMPDVLAWLESQQKKERPGK